MPVSSALRPFLDDLESRIVPEQEEALLQQWTEFSEGRFGGDVFAPRRNQGIPPTLSWPRVSVNQALEDFDLMALQQYGACSGALAGGGGAMLNVRCNYGSSIAPLLFGVELFLMDDALNTLPTSWPLNDLGAIRRLIDAGVPDLRTGFGYQVLEMGERYAAIAEEYPNIGRYVHIYHPDLQGPMDICEVVWGSSVFYSLYDQPELVKQVLELATQTYIEFMRAWEAITPFRPNGNAHWGLFHKGNIMLRDDSAMNLSPEMFDEFIRPYDQRLLDEFGGGAIHFCGKGDHYIASMSEMRGLYAINMSQPEYNDMELIYTNTVDKNIKLIGLRRQVAEEATAGGRALRGQVHAA